jgi:hypothetical protein
MWPHYFEAHEGKRRSTEQRQQDENQDIDSHWGTSKILEFISH